MTDFTINDMLEMTIGDEKMLSFVSVANPPVQARARCNVINQGRPMFYDPSKAKKDAFGLAVKNALLAHHIQMPVFREEDMKKKKGVRMHAHFFIPRIQADYRFVNGQRVLITNPQPYPHVKDIDNLVKFAADALKYIMFEDDSCVCGLSSTKAFVPENTTGPEQAGFTTFRFEYMFEDDEDDMF
jgi:Holliday junction resolvase RusA-like endonuclease